MVKRLQRLAGEFKAAGVAIEPGSSQIMRLTGLWPRYVVSWHQTRNGQREQRCVMVWWRSPARVVRRWIEDLAAAIADADPR